MEPVRIAHISDLHFGAENQRQTWDTLARHLRDDVKPDLVLVTGDIADTPQTELYEEAKRSLDALCGSIAGKTVRYYVCPGNHDRFPHGNAPFFQRKTGRIRKWLLHWASEFNRCFEGHTANLTAPADVGLGPETNRWNIRVVGLDSSIHADASARGFIDREDIEKLRAAMQMEAGKKAEDIDLGILLVHHHLLPIRSLESERQGRWSDLWSLTPLVNAGTLVEALAAAHIDIALHGHEHAENWGRYATFETGGGETNVIAAGSATGTITLKPCDPGSISYNLLELREDRTVRLLIVGHDAARVRWDSRGREFDIYDSQALRRARFMRRARGSIFRRPSSDVTKYIEFTRERDGIVKETRTQIDFSESPILAITPDNTTGFPTELRIALTDEDGNRWEPEGELRFRIGNQPGLFYYQCAIPEKVAAAPQKVEFSYRWFGGAVLTAEEVDALEPVQRGELRAQHCEFGAIQVDTFYHSLRLIVRIPPEFAPPPGDVSAYVKNPNSQSAAIAARGEEVPLQSDVANGLRIVGDGLYSLTVPYPRVGFEYGIKWKLPRAGSVMTADAELAAQFVAASRKHRDRLAEAFYRGLAGTPLAGRSTVSIYVPGEKARHVLEMVGSYPSGTHPPAAIRTANEAMLVTQAWRGVPTVAVEPPDASAGASWWDVGLMPGEHGLIALPVRFGINWTNDAPWGVVRIGIHEFNGDVGAMLDQANGRQLLSRMMRPMIMMLNEAGVGS
jgi:3',5'-cyclic AMP phosphodiesterase CpdA